MASNPPPPPPPPPPRPGYTAGGSPGAPATPQRPNPTSQALLTPSVFSRGTIGQPLFVPDPGASSSSAPPAQSPLAAVYINQHVPLVLSLNPPNFSQWRTLFEVMFQKYAVQDHTTGPPRAADPTWAQDDAHIVSWLYNRVSAEIFGLIHQRGASAADVWASICTLFLENSEHQIVFLSTDFRRIEQGSSSIIAYFARLKDCADRLADLGTAVTDRDQVLNMFRGLHPRFRYAIPILTMQTPFPTFLRCRAFFMLEESRQAREHPPETALHVARAPGQTNTGGGGGGGGHTSRGNNHGGGGRNKGKVKAHASGGGQASHSGGGGSTPRPPAPAPAPWTGMVHAWPMPWWPHAPGSGILGARRSSLCRHGVTLRRSGRRSWWCASHRTACCVAPGRSPRAPPLRRPPRRRLYWRRSHWRRGRPCYTGMGPNCAHPRPQQHAAAAGSAGGDRCRLVPGHRSHHLHGLLLRIEGRRR